MREILPPCCLDRRLQSASAGEFRWETEPFIERNAMKLRFDYNLPAPPATAWPYLTDPVRMNEWSDAHIELLNPGPGGRPDEPGATRQATIRSLGATSRLVELVVESSPPERMVYRVTSGGLIRNHRGVVELTAVPGGSRLVWQIEFGAPFPGLARVLGWMFRPKMEQGLTALAKLLSHSGVTR
jgi:uncharacterized protein YndB with AHSA1/START domain